MTMIMKDAEQYGGSFLSFLIDMAYEVGKHIAACGGLDGIMEAASKGAFENNGTVLWYSSGQFQG
jgi:predicted Rossmann-fold nucleotide-binding protein